MQYRNLGRAGVKVSPLCLGTMNFGPRTSEEDSFAIMDRALDEGINFFDTANRYGMQVHVGYTEEIIGPRTMEQLESALAVLEMELSGEDMERLDEIWPGPGGEAPEAYAW